MQYESVPAESARVRWTCSDSECETSAEGPEEVVEAFVNTHVAHSYESIPAPEGEDA